MAEKWQVSGSYFESCNCEAACPCIFLSPPTTGDCTVLIAWHIEEGRYGDVSLDGLNVAMAAHSPGHMMEVPWRAALYLDNGANEAQGEALVKIFGGQAGGHLARVGEHIGEVAGVRQAEIQFEANGRERSLRLNGVGEMNIAAIGGQAEGEVTVEGMPLCIAPGYPAVVARAEKLSYHDHGMDWELTEKNGFYSPFAYQGP